MSNLIKRTLTGAVYIAAIVASLCVHPLLFAAVFSLITGLLVHEFYALTRYEGLKWQRYAGTLGGAYLFAATFLYAGAYVGGIIFLPYIFLLLTIFISGLYVKNTSPVNALGKFLFGQVYCAGCMSLLNLIAFHSGAYNYLPILLLFIFIWLNDTGAFLVGSWLGRHRLFERISPKKSWEGFFGGLAIVVIAALLLMLCRDSLSQREAISIATHSDGFTWSEAITNILFAIFLVIAATFGDLFESLLKRACNVKDSGAFLPGHGGFLDRFDSLLFAIPTIYALIRCLY